MGSKLTRITFYRFLESKNKRKKLGKNENFGEISEKSENRNFGGDILSISADISAKISDILFPAS